MIIGITGQSGSGKSTVSELFKKNGYYIIDCDKIAHELMKSNSDMLDEIGEEFGEEFVADGVLDRKKLGAIVFNDSIKLKKLNAITHKYILSEVNSLLCGREKVVIDAPLLIEAELHKVCDKNIFVCCPENIRAERIVKRDGVSMDYALSRLKSQHDDEFYKNVCDIVVINDGICDYKEQLKELFD